MNDNQFDKFFRDKLGDHSSPVPEDMWQRIQREKDKDRKIFFIPRWYAIAAVLLLLIGVSSYFFWHKANTSAKGVAVLNKQNAGAASGNVITNKTTENKTIKKHELNAALLKTKEIKNNKQAVAKYNIANANKQVAITNETLTKREENNNEGKAAKTFSQPNGNAPGEAIQQQTGEMVQEEKKDEKAASSVALENKTTGEKKQPENKAQGKNKNSNTNNLFLEVYASPEVAWKNTTGNINNGSFTNAPQSDYINERKRTEKLLISYTAGARINKQVAKNILLKTGLQYNQVNEKFNYEDNNATREVSVPTTRYINYAGSFVAVRDTANYIQTGYRKKTTYNHYNSINVPLLVSYERGNNKFKIAVTAGAVINVYTWYKGYMLDTALKPVPINSQHFLKHNTGIGLYAGINAVKTFGKNFSFFAEPHIQYNLSNMTTSRAPFKQKISAAGISLGIRYNVEKLKQHK